MTTPPFSLHHLPPVTSVLGQLFAPVRADCLACLAVTERPGAVELTALATARGIVVGGEGEARGQALRFTPPTNDGWGYEMRIAQFGCVETRTESWHDFFNALVWLRFPLAKAALSAAHYAAMSSAGRGQRRDALTHFDECGVILVARDPAYLAQVREFRWRGLFWDNRADLAANLEVVIFGHATYEQLLQPFRGLTAKAILLHLPPEHAYWQMVASERWAFLDAYLADYLSRPATTLTRPRDLHPFPLLGLPDLVPENNTASYYDDTWQFRTGRREKQS